MLFVGVVVIGKVVLEHMDVRHCLVHLWNINERKAAVVDYDYSEMVELIVVVVVVAEEEAVERLNDDDRLDFENIDDDEY